MLNEGVTLSGTGHRPTKLGGYTQQAFNKLVDVITSYLDSNPPDLVISGMALGFDQALCRAAINVNIPIWAAIPFVGQESPWPTQSRVIYKALLERCEKQIVVCKGGYAAYKLQRRNEWMVDQLTKPDDILLTIYDGTEGGTRNCIEYAKTKGVNIINLYDIWSKW